MNQESYSQQEILKPEGMPTLLKNAESMAEDLIDQFNSDNENSL